MKLKAIMGIVLALLFICVLTLAFNIDGGYVLADVGWNIETVDSVGYDTSIALDSDENPHISYWDLSNYNLKYAYYEAPVGGIWVPVDKFALLTPYIGLASTIIAATAAVAIYVKRRKKKQ